MKMTVTLWSMPVKFIGFWWDLHMISKRICGRWNGVRIYANGNIVILDEKLGDFIEKCMGKVEDNVERL